jgi:hypothetical protein
MSLILNRIPPFWCKQDIVDFMRGIDGDDCSRYLRTASLTDNEMMAILKMPGLTEQVRDQVVCMLYNIPEAKIEEGYRNTKPEPDMVAIQGRSRRRRRFPWAFFFRGSQ